jgi:hypothetical protein
MRAGSLFPSFKTMTLLSRLLLVPRGDDAVSSSWMREELDRDISHLTWDEFDDLLNLASLNHVVMRGMEVLLELVRARHDEVRAQWAIDALAEEQGRIAKAIPFLHEICTSFEHAGLNVSVIKSLDHWPDLGSDLDLYTDARPDQVIQLMTGRFNAHVEARSWGDRLACKWNFKIPELPELIEIHVGRLGQTGEQVAIASSLLHRTRMVTVDGRSFRVPSKSDRILISTLQRMYRHFYFRLCDVIDSAALVETDGIDLPVFVTGSARFGGDAVYYGRGFLRVPLMPQSARLYGSQLADILRRRQLHNGARLSLLPWLATAAVVGQKFTGSDKGIW